MATLSPVISEDTRNKFLFTWSMMGWQKTDHLPFICVYFQISGVMNFEFHTIEITTFDEVPRMLTKLRTTCLEALDEP